MSQERGLIITGSLSAAESFSKGPSQSEEEQPAVQCWLRVPASNSQRSRGRYATDESNDSLTNLSGLMIPPAS